MFEESIKISTEVQTTNHEAITIIYFPDDNKEYWIFNLTRSSFDFVQVSFFFAVKFVMSKVESPDS